MKSTTLKSHQILYDSLLKVFRLADTSISQYVVTRWIFIFYAKAFVAQLRKRWNEGRPASPTKHVSDGIIAA